MKQQERCAGNRIPTRIGLIGLATVLGLALTLTVVLAQSPNFGLSYKSGPAYTKLNDVITYTILAINTGDAVQTVALSDVLPSKLEFVAGSCTYDDGSFVWPCLSGPPGPLWEKDFAPGTRITTTLAATVTASTLHWPLVNHACLSWSGGRHEVAFTTTVLSAVPMFDPFYQLKPPNADTGGLITYTIVAVNSGDSVSDVVLSDTLPSGVEFVPDSCFYDVKPSSGPDSVDLPCDIHLVSGERRALWLQDMPRGTRITTTLLVTVTVPESSSRWPLVYCAYLGWDVIEKEACGYSLANPTVYTHLPLVLRNYGFDPYEPNDTPLQAYGPLVSGRVYAAYIWDAYDRNDYYYFTPMTDTTDVHITLTNIPANCNYDLYVYDDSTSPVPLESSAQYGNVDESITFTPAAAQLYYIRIYPDPDVVDNFSRRQPYHLIATYQ